jgi:hypothetical protein
MNGNDDRDWRELGEAWRTEPPDTASPPDAASATATSTTARVKRASRRASIRGWYLGLTTCVAIAFVTSLSFAHRSIVSYTFTVIAWSAFLALGGYLLGTREPASESALATLVALTTRASRLSRTAQLLEFGRTLVGVETFICIGFWLALHYRGETHNWMIAIAMMSAGLALFVTLSALLAKTRHEIDGLESIASAIGRDE